MRRRKDQIRHQSGNENRGAKISVNIISPDQKSLEQSFYLQLHNLELPQKCDNKSEQSSIYESSIRTAASQVVVPSSKPEVVSTSRSFTYSSISKFHRTSDSQSARMMRKNKEGINQEMKQRLESKMNMAFKMLDDLRESYIKRKAEKDSILSISAENNEKKRLSFA